MKIAIFGAGGQGSELVQALLKLAAEAIIYSNPPKFLSRGRGS